MRFAKYIIYRVKIKAKLWYHKYIWEPRHPPIHLTPEECKRAELVTDEILKELKLEEKGI